MKILRNILAIAAFVMLATSCDDGKSYAELLTEEDYAVNNFLADQVVILDMPADTVFEVGADAPYYRIDEDGALYMQVLNAGTKGYRVNDNEQIYFRYTRYALANYKDGKLPQGTGNNLSLSPAWFRYNNFRIQSSYTWGYGIQRPLDFLPVDCEVLMLIKSQMGPTSEQSNVQPYLYRLTYERRQ